MPAGVRDPVSALKGLFTDITEDPVTYVNAPLLAKERGCQSRLLTEETELRHTRPLARWLTQPLAAFEASVHARAVAAGKAAATCSSCHGSHDIRPAGDPHLDRLLGHHANSMMTWSTARLSPGAAASQIVIEGGAIPYLPAALEKKTANAAGWMNCGNVCPKSSRPKPNTCSP